MSEMSRIKWAANNFTTEFVEKQIQDNKNIAYFYRNEPDENYGDEYSEQARWWEKVKELQNKSKAN